jgi:hypothetical protein
LTTDVLAKSFGSRAPRLFSDRGVSLFLGHAAHAARSRSLSLTARCDANAIAPSVSSTTRPNECRRGTRSDVLVALISRHQLPPDHRPQAESNIVLVIPKVARTPPRRKTLTSYRSPPAYQSLIAAGRWSISMRREYAMQNRLHGKWSAGWRSHLGPSAQRLRRTVGAKYPSSRRGM